MEEKTIVIAIWIAALIVTVLFIIGKIQGLLKGEWLFICSPILFTAFSFIGSFLIRYTLSKILKS